MPNHHFISYSTADAGDFALRLCDALIMGPPSLPAWLDKRELKPGLPWDEQIVEALSTCDSLIFVMTVDSVEPMSVCKNEWTRALKYKKPIVPLLLHHDAEVPFQLENRQYIDFTDDFDVALARLRTHLGWLKSPEGKLSALKDRLMDAQRALRRTADAIQQQRTEADIAELKRQIADGQQLVENPEGVAERVQESIDRGLERERQPVRPISGETRTKFINPPPGIAPTYFQDRHVEMDLIGDFLKDDAERLMTVVGRAGIGKTAMVCRLLKSLESGVLPDDGGKLSVDGIVYLSENGSRKVSFVNLFFDLCRLLPDAVAQRLDGVYKDPQTPTADKMLALLRAFPEGRVLVLLDSFEDKVNPTTRAVADDELNEALKAVLTAEPHAVKVMLTTRIAPRDLALLEPGRQRTLHLDEGLVSPYAENILRKMDRDGTLGLKAAPEGLLDEARRRTNGYPRALEALFAILSADRETSLEDILADSETLLPEHVVEKLVGEAFNRLDGNAQMVMQALGVYARPVTAAAVDYLLQPHLPGVKSATVWNRLVNMQFVRKEGDRYYLHPVDREYALSRVPKGERADRDLAETVFSRFALWSRGADYFKMARTPSEDWKSIEDLAPQLAEFELRYAGEDYDTAASVLLEIDRKYLFSWGHYRVMIEFHEQLMDKLTVARLKQDSVGNLGSAYYSMGQHRKAIACYEQALEIAKEIGDRQNEGRWLGNLGNCYSNLGEYRCAIAYHQQALKIAKYIDDRRGEGSSLGNLANCYRNLGESECAIASYQQALKIAKEVSDQQGEGIWLANLGNYYRELGEYRHASEFLHQSLHIAREIDLRYLESADLCYLGAVLLDASKFDSAIENLNRAIQIADEIEFAQFRNEARYVLAVAYLWTEKFAESSRVIREARQHDYPRNNQNVWALQGLLDLRMGNLEAAREGFESAVAASDALLVHSAQNYRALDTKGLSLSGLSLCGGNSDFVRQAETCYRQARAINRDAGYLHRVVRLFDALSEADDAGLLTAVRRVLVP